MAQSVPSYHSSLEVRKQAEQLRTTDKDEIQRRWGDLASLANKAWIHDRRGTSDSFGMDIKWIVPGAAMHIAFAWCNKPSNCKMEWVVQYNAEQKQLEFISATNELVKTGTVLPDGSVNTAANSLFGSSEKWKYDAAANTFTLEGGILSTYSYSEVSRQQLLTSIPMIKEAQTLAANTQPVAAAITTVAAVAPGQTSSKPTAPAKPVPQEEPSAKVKSEAPAGWDKAACSDAGYGGRPAFHCKTGLHSEKSIDELTALISVHTWASPGINSRAWLHIWRSPRFRPDKSLADPIVLKVDGRIVRQFLPAELIDSSGGPGDRFFSATVPFTEALIQELASGEEVTLEITEANGQTGSIRFPSLAASRSILRQLPEQTRTEYSAYYKDSKDKTTSRRNNKPSATASNRDVWGPLGEAADRSVYWTNKSHDRLNVLRLNWTEPNKAMQLEFDQCENNYCEVQKWTIRANANAIVSGKLATTLVFYNEANKPVMRYEKLDEKVRFSATEFDPVLYSDMRRSLGNIFHPQIFGKSKNPCCIELNFRDYSPVPSQEDVHRLYTEHAEVHRRRIAQAAAAERTRQIQEEQARIDYDRRVYERDLRDRDRLGTEPQRPSFAQTFTNTFQQEMRGKQAQEVRQQANLNNLARQIGAVERDKDSARAPDRRGAEAAYSNPMPPTRSDPSRDTRGSQVSIATPDRSDSNVVRATGSNRKQTGRPLTFILLQPMQAGTKSKSNPYCFSNVITVPGPDGFQTATEWGGSAPGVVEKAIEMIKAYYQEFQQKCDQTADGQIRGKPYNSPQYDFNTKSEPDRVQRVHASQKSRGPETVEVYISPR